MCVCVGVCVGVCEHACVYDMEESACQSCWSRN